MIKYRYSQPMEEVMDKISIKAYAKINLGLNVLRKRDDGYHDVSMIMQSINLYDTLTIKRMENTGISVSTNLSYLPTDKGNLVYLAAKLFVDTFHITDGLYINLDKKIPVAAGLAGGSSDAAATLKALNELYQTGLTLNELMNLGIKLGADVPYCIMLGTALSEGIGEILTPLDPIPPCYIILVKPSISVSTKYVYENLLINSDIFHPDIKKMIHAIESRDLNELASHMDNILQTVTIKNYPIITKIKEQLLELGALTSLMSGSGPTVFGIYDKKEIAEKAYEILKTQSLGKEIFLTEPIWPSLDSSMEL